MVQEMVLTLLLGVFIPIVMVVFCLSVFSFAIALWEFVTCRWREVDWKLLFSRTMTVVGVLVILYTIGFVATWALDMSASELLALERIE